MHMKTEKHIQISAFCHSSPLNRAQEDNIDYVFGLMISLCKNSVFYHDVGVRHRHHQFL